LDLLATVLAELPGAAVPQGSSLSEECRDSGIFAATFCLPAASNTLKALVLKTSREARGF
jgi:hypothetical protein